MTDNIDFPATLNRSDIERLIKRTSSPIPPELQPAYQSFLFKHQARFLLLINLLAYGAYLSYGLADALVIPDVLALSIAIRVGSELLTLPLVLTLFRVSRNVLLLDMVLPFLVIFASIGWVTLLLQTESAAATTYQYAGVIFVVLANLGVRARFGPTVLFSALIAAVTLYGVVRLSHGQTQDVAVFILVYLPVFFFSLFISWTNVVAGRRMFLRTALEALDRRALSAVAAQLTVAKDEAESASQAKSEFLTRMSHELRTPLNSLLAGTQLLGTENLSEQGRGWLKSMSHAGRQLNEQVQDILDLSKIEKGYLPLNQEPFVMHSLLEDVVDSFKLQELHAEHPFHIRLEADACRSLPTLSGDAYRLRQILNNLISNAIKYAPGKTVTLSAEQIPGEAHAIWLKLCVRDQGPGIPASKLDGLFELFHREHDNHTPGFGIGLYVCKLLAERMGGSIHVESELGSGSCFCVHLPFSQAANAPRQEFDDKAMPNLSILLADDHDINRGMIMQMLQLAGHQVTAVVNGREAVDAVQSGLYQLVLLDVRMPVMDGFEAARRIRGLADAEASEVEIIALTADVTNETRQACLAAGMDHVLSKPFNIETLNALLRDEDFPESKTNAAEGWSSRLTTSELNHWRQLQQQSLMKQHTDIQPLWREQRWQEVADILHLIAGTAAMGGYEQIQRKALRMEETLREQPERFPPDEWLADLLAEMDRQLALAR